MKSLLLLITVSLLAACSTTPKATEPEIIAQQEKLGKFINRPIAKPDNKNILFSLSRFFGAPQHQEFSSRANLKNPKLQEKNYTMVYEGFEINVAETQIKQDQNYYLRRLVVHDNVLKLPYDIKIGQGLQDLKKLFGEPQKNSTAENMVSYCETKADISCVRFYLSENDQKVERIIWDYAEH